MLDEWNNAFNCWSRAW